MLNNQNETILLFLMCVKLFTYIYIIRLIFIHNVIALLYKGSEDSVNDITYIIIIYWSRASKPPDFKCDDNNIISLENTSRFINSH